MSRLPRGSGHRRQPTAFATRVLGTVCRIPPGRLATYGEIAAAAGRPRASRAVGNILRGCRAPAVPAHRVVAAQGRLGGFGGNLQLKRELLRLEGVIVAGSRITNWRERRWLAPANEAGRDRRRGLAPRA